MFPLICVHAYIRTKKREVRSFFTLDEGFAIPLHSRKTTEVHARYVQPTHPYNTGKDYATDIHIHEDIHRCCYDCARNFAKIPSSRKQRQ